MSRVALRITVVLFMLLPFREAFAQEASNKNDCARGGTVDCHCCFGRTTALYSSKYSNANATPDLLRRGKITV